MRLSVFGLGYVGCVSAACFVKLGHQVLGVDINEGKLDLIRSGKAPIIEPEIGDLVKAAVECGKLTVTDSATEGVLNSEMGLIAVGTPSETSGALDLKYIKKVCERIGTALKKRKHDYIIVIRSTMLPGSIQDLVLPTLEEFSGKKEGDGYHLVVNPEFLREGTSVYDFFNPPKTVIGSFAEGSFNQVKRLYEGIEAPVIQTTPEIAEMLKYADNLYHATKITFANEIGRLCKASHIDSHQVMDIFCLDTKLNISKTYLRPGYAFGGSCLPKDLRAALAYGKEKNLDLQMLGSLLESNKSQVNEAYSLIKSFGDRKKTLFLGLSFKANTDDLRESPLVELAEKLLGKGTPLKIYDPNVSLSRLMGANKMFIEEHLPHIGDLLTDDLESATQEAELIVVGNKTEEYKVLVEKLSGDKNIVDLVRILDKKSEGNYQGLSW